MTTEFQKYRPDQARDSAGRFTRDIEAGATELERTALLPREGDDTRGPVRDIARHALTTLHEKAAELAGRARLALTSTKFAGVSPLPSGGIEIRASHGLPSGRGHMTSYLQIHPYGPDHMKYSVKNPAAQKALKLAHDTLRAFGRPYATHKTSAVGGAFKNGPQP